LFKVNRAKQQMRKGPQHLGTGLKPVRLTHPMMRTDAALDAFLQCGNEARQSIKKDDQIAAILLMFTSCRTAHKC